MRIIVNDIAASNGGALKIISDFYKYVRNESDCNDIEWHFFLNDHYFEETCNIKIHIYKKGSFNWIRRLYFDNYLINKLNAKIKADGIISFQNTCSFGLRIPQMLYMHQILPFQNTKKFSFLKKNEIKLAIYQHIIGRLIKRSVKLADLVVVQANWIKSIVAQKTKKDVNSIVVNPIDLKIEGTLTERDIKDGNIKFFYPAFESVYKNQKIIYEANKILLENQISVDIILTIEKGGEEPCNIRKIGTIPYEEVQKLYASTTLIFPSYIETIGLPLLEAMSMNCIILVADCEYARETLGNYANAYFFNPFNPEELANLMRDIINGKIKKSDTAIEIHSQSNWKNVINRFQQIIIGKTNGQ